MGPGLMQFLYTPLLPISIPGTEGLFHTEAFVQSKKNFLIFFYVLFGQNWRHSGKWDTFKEQNIISVRKAREYKEKISETGSLDVTSTQLPQRMSWLCRWRGQWQGLASSLRMWKPNESFEAFFISCRRGNTGITPWRACQTKLNHCHIVMDILAQNGVPNCRYKGFI